MYWTYKLGVRQNTVGDNLSDSFRVKFPLQRDPNGYFLVAGKGIYPRHESDQYGLGGSAAPIRCAALGDVPDSGEKLVWTTGKAAFIRTG